MATTISKQRTVNHLVALQELASETAVGELPVLDQFIFALCRENATEAQAQAAFTRLKTMFFDWNEVRVSSTREIEEAMAGLSDTEPRAHRLLAFLQEVFEDRFSFDLEDVIKKGLKQGAKQLARFGAANDYVASWVVQRSLGGHAIPVDSATLRCSQRLGLIDRGMEDPETARGALEHLVTKAKGTTFTDCISNLAESHCWEMEPRCVGCPMQGECPTGQEVSGEQLATARTARVKPR